MQLHTYAETQTNLSSWSREDTRYVINGSSFLANYGKIQIQGDTNSFILLSSILSSLLTLGLFAFSLFYIIVLYSQTYAKAPKYIQKRHLSFFWTVVAVAAQLNFIIFICEFIASVRYLSTGSTASRTKTIWFSYLSLFCLSIAVFTGGPKPFKDGMIKLCNLVANYKHCKKPCTHIIREYNKLEESSLLSSEFHEFLLCIPCNILFGFVILLRKCLCKKTKKEIVTQIFLFMYGMLWAPTLFFSFASLSFYLVPILLLLFVYPVKVIAVYSFIITAVILYILVAFYIFYRAQHLDENNCWLFFIFLIVMSCSCMFFAIISIIFVPVYNALTYGGLSNNSVLQAFLSLIPSSILAFLIWIVKKRLKKSTEQEASRTSEDDKQEASRTSEDDKQEARRTAEDDTNL